MNSRPVISTLVLLVSGIAMSVGAETLPYDHVHLAVPDPDKAVQWYISQFGGKVGVPADRVVLGKYLIIFLKSATAQPSAGSAIDHIGFSVPDLPAKMKALEAAGAKVTMPIRENPGFINIAFVEDPWGVKIEVVQDPDVVGLHHLHLRVPDPDATFTWYVNTFGGERGMFKGRMDGVRYGDVWLLAQKADAPPPPSAGHAIDHLGWRPASADEAFKAFAAKGVKITAEPRAIRDLRAGFIEDPNGVRIEVVQRPPS